MSTDIDRLRAIQDELNRVLEDRITELLAQARAIRQVTSHITVTELEIRRQEAMRLELEKEACALDADNGEITKKVEALKEHLQRLRKTHEESMSSLSGLIGEVQKGLPGGSR